MTSFTLKYHIKLKVIQFQPSIKSKLYQQHTLIKKYGQCQTENGRFIISQQLIFGMESINHSRALQNPIEM
jgi:hypothetical protein